MTDGKPLCRGGFCRKCVEFQTVYSEALKKNVRRCKRLQRR